MKLVTAEEMAALDRKAAGDYGIPSIVLMENAGSMVARAVLKLLRGNRRGPKVLVLAGKGNNGGDGLVAARHLLNRGIEVKVFLLAREEDLQGDAAINLKIYRNMGGRVYTIADDKGLQRLDIALLYADVVVDAIYGTGFKGKVAGDVAKVIELVNQRERPVISVDLPSGLEANSGRVHGACIRAGVTVTFGLPKAGHLLEEGRIYCGELQVADIGIPAKLVQETDLKLDLITAEECRWLLPVRPLNGHKGTFGHVTVFGGATGLTGAVYLAATAALRAGCGKVTAGVPSALHQIMEQKTTEVMTLPLPQSPEGTLSRESLAAILELASKADAVALGPGLGADKGQTELLAELLPNLEVPLVLDADGLNALAGHPQILTQLKAPVILTPHPGEMARLLGVSVAKVQFNRLQVARQAAREWGAVVVLKGSATVVAAPTGDAAINVTGNPGLGTAGSGDVLTGIIASFLAQGLTPGNAAALGVYLHGLAGDLAADDLGQASLVAGELLAYLPRAFKKLEEGGREGLCVQFGPKLI